MTQQETEKHTPGPWTVEYVAGGGYDTLSSAYRIKYGEDSRRERVCEVDTRDYDDRIEADDHRHYGTETSVEAEANAHLIAAAPELLAALKNARGIVCSRMCPAINGETLMHDDICKGILAAIQKAEGR